MDITTTLMGIGFLVVFIGPVLLVIYRQTNKNRTLKKELLVLCKEENIQVDELEITHNFVFGIDKTKKKWILSKQPDITENLKIIDLEKLKTINLRLTETKKNGVEQVKIFYDDGLSPTEICLYDEGVDVGIDALVCKHIAQKWIQLLKEV